MRGAIVAVFAVGLTAGCGFAGGAAGCHAQIDWVDFVEVGSVQYVAALSPTLAQGDLGQIVARVKFKVSGNVCDPSYRLRDGDAAFLDPGTPIYAVNGYPTSQLLAAAEGTRIVPYRSLSVAGA